MWWRNAWTALKVSAAEAWWSYGVVGMSLGTPRPEDAQGRSTRPEARFTGTSRAFWLYCATLSLLFFAMGIGALRHGTTLAGGKFGPVTAHRSDPRTGVGLIVVGGVVMALCLTNGVRRRP